jgi:hypothetical protein
MNGRNILLLLILLAPCPVLAGTMSMPSTPASAACRQAIAAAERAHGIPPHLLAAIARVESGRRDEVSGTFSPWPWTINIDGQGSFYESKAEAMAAASSMRSHAARSIDVGCMQISLVYHPDAFPDMSMAFEPASNAEYGAKFLTQLFEKTNSWPRAVELYHSATLDIGQVYGRRVYAALPEEQKLAEAIQPFSMGGGMSASNASHPIPFAPLRAGSPHIIPLSTGLAGTLPLGRSLDAYRTAPVRFAFRPS